MEEKRQLIYSAISSHHCSIIMEKLFFQFKDSRNCDLEIRVSDGRIFAHKCLVDIFFTQVGTELEDDRFVLDLSDFNEDIITCLLDMMYTGELCIQPHLIQDLQSTASKLGYFEAEKGCKTYLSSYSNNDLENADSPRPFRIVKEEPVDTGYQDSETSQTGKGNQDEFETFASNYVQNLIGPVQAENQSGEAQSLPSTSSVSASKNIYEIVQGQPSKQMKLPDIVVEKANELSGGHVMKNAVDTAPALQKDRDPFLIVSRDNGVVTLKKEKKIDPTLFKGNNKVKSVAKAQEQSWGKTVLRKQVSWSQASKVVNVNKSLYGVNKTIDCATGTTDEYSSDADMSDEYSDDSLEAQVVLENVEQSVPKVTRSGRTSKRPALFTGQNAVKRKRGRPRKPQMDPYEYAELMRTKEERKNEAYRRRKKVVIDKREYESDKFKLIAAAGSVPEGCKSRYGRMELMKTKLVTETVCKGDGSVSVTTKEVPRRMTWHERQADKQKPSEPVFVICHPTAPVVRH